MLPHIRGLPSAVCPALTAPSPFKPFHARAGARVSKYFINIRSASSPAMESLNLHSLADTLQSITGLIIQTVGIFLVTSLSFFMTRSIRRTSLIYWTIGWACLAASLVSLTIAFRIGSFHKLLFSVYFLGEYCFGYMLLAGCRNYASGNRLTRRSWSKLIPAVAIALVLPRVSDDFNDWFIFHAAILAGLFAAAFASLVIARRGKKASPGLRVMTVALALLTLDFLHYVPIMIYVKLYSVGSQLAYLKYNSIYDLILEILLGFGTVMMVMDEVRHEVEGANRELVAARDRLELLARVDPLTEALNRHAFYSLLEKKRDDAESPATGSVVVIDIDNLKPINDSLGHTAGDHAIREVAHALRSLIRTEDLLFRWGGDEFLVLLYNISEDQTRARINKLDGSIARTSLPGAETPVALVVSYGIASFSALDQIGQAIEQADDAMYLRKQSRKTQDRLDRVRAMLDRAQEKLSLQS